MILPDPRARMCGTAARAHSHGPLRLTAITRSHSAGVISPKGLRSRPPYSAALFTRMSIRPQRSTVTSAMRCVAASPDTPTAPASAWPPAVLIAASVPLAPPRSMSAAATDAPASLRARLKARPSPRAAPVTIATRPSSGPRCAISTSADQRGARLGERLAGHSCRFGGEEPVIDLPLEPPEVLTQLVSKAAVVDLHRCPAKAPQLVGVLDDLVVQGHRRLARVVPVDDRDDLLPARSVVSHGGEDLVGDARALYLVHATQVRVRHLRTDGLEVLILRDHLPSALMENHRRQHDGLVGLAVFVQEAKGKAVRDAHVKVVVARIQIRSRPLVDLGVLLVHVGDHAPIPF